MTGRDMKQNETQDTGHGTRNTGQGTLTKRGCLTFTFSWTSFVFFTFGAFSFLGFVFFPPPSSDVHAISETEPELGLGPETRSLVRCVCVCTDDRTSVRVLAASVNVSSDDRGRGCACACG